MTVCADLKTCAAALAVVLLACAGEVRAWGGGHHPMQQMIVDHLPAPIAEGASKAALAESVSKWSKYPDSFETFEAEAELIGPSGMATLKQYGVDRRYDLHHDWARPVAWICMVQALREKRYDAAVFWSACLGHSVGDMVATNHHPLAHQATYEWPRLKDVILPGGRPLADAAGLLDLKAVEQSAMGRRIAAETVEAMRLPDDGAPAQQVMLRIMKYGFQGAAYCAQRGSEVVRYAVEYTDGGGASVERALWRNLGELGAWGAVRVLRDVEAAMRVAATGESVTMTDELHAAYRQWVNQWVAQRPLHEETMFAPLLKPVMDTTRGAVGVVMEPTWRMNEGFLGFHARLIAASTARTLAESERAYVTLDVRDLAAGHWPKPGQVAVVVVAASQMRGRYHPIDGRRFAEAMDDYLQAGGRVLWIAGQGALPRPALEAIASTAEQTSHKPWPIDPQQFTQWRLRLAPGETTWPFVRSPEINVGWQRPYCAYRFEPDGQTVRPLLELVRDDRTITVGVVQDRNGQPAAACIPIYAVHPMLLQLPETLDDPATPRLDGPGRTILLKALDRLTTVPPQNKSTD